MSPLLTRVYLRKKFFHIEEYVENIEKPDEEN